MAKDQKIEHPVEKFRTRFTRNRVAWKKSDKAVCRVVKSMQDECDINKIMAKYMKTGLLPNQKSNPLYGDFSEVPSYQEAFALVDQAQRDFRKLPAAVRKRFENNPQEFLEFVTDRKNAEEMIKLGIMAAPAAPGASHEEPPVVSPTGGKKASKEAAEPVKKGED